jgi:hypothetical protein
VRRMTGSSLVVTDSWRGVWDDFRNYLIRAA